MRASARVCAAFTRVCWVKSGKGSSLSAALEAQQVFPPLMLGMIRAGEGSGKLDQVAERLAIHYEKAHQMNQQVKSALMYPMILAILAVAVVIVIVTFVLPRSAICSPQWIRCRALRWR